VLRKNVDDIFSRVDTIHQRDGQTDGQTERQMNGQTDRQTDRRATAKTALIRIASHGKNYNDAPTRTSKKCDDISILFDSTGIGQTDGRTDKIGKTISRSACIGVLARDKTSKCLSIREDLKALYKLYCVGDILAVVRVYIVGPHADRVYITSSCLQ